MEAFRCHQNAATLMRLMLLECGQCSYNADNAADGLQIDTLRSAQPTEFRAVRGSKNAGEQSSELSEIQNKICLREIDPTRGPSPQSYSMADPIDPLSMQT